MSTRRIKFLAGGAVVVAAIGVLVGVSLQGNMAYYIEVDDYLARGPAAVDGNFRVKGRVVPGTIAKDPGKLGAAFEMVGGGGALMTVRYGKELPDTFVDNAEVVVEGAMGPDAVFEAHTLLAKCPSKYEAAAAAGEENPHTPS